MAVPVITSAVLNKTSYAPGEKIIATVVGSDADETQLEVVFVLRNKVSGEKSAPVTAQAVVDELEAAATSSPAKTWTQTGRVGSSFTLTTTA